MNLASMNPRDRRALTIGAILAIPGLLVPLVVKPYLNVLTAVQEQTADEHDRLIKEQQAIAALPTLPAERARASHRLDSEVNRLFQSSDALVATGDLAQYVSSAAQDNGLSLQQSETRPSRPVVPGVEALQVEVRAEGDLDGMLHFLHQLEMGGKLIRVGTLSITGGGEPQGQQQAPGGGAGQGQGQGLGQGQAPDQASGVFTSLFGRRRRRMQEQAQGQGTGQGPQQGQGLQQGPPPDTNRLQGAEVLSLSANVYGYRLTGASWSSTDTHGKTAPSPFSRPAYDFESLDAVVDHDLFNVTRSRPAVSYRVALSGGRQGELQGRRAREVELQLGRRLLDVVGTVSAGANSFAMLQVHGSDNAPQVVHVGEQFNGYTLVALHPGEIVLTTPHGDRLEKQLLEPGSSQ